MLLIQKAAVLTGTGKNYACADVLVGDDGLIAAVGEGLSVPQGACVLDASGLTLSPGMIDAHCHVGIDEEGLGWEGSDDNECTEPSTPFLRAMDAINPKDRGLREALCHGITTVCTGPGSGNVIAGDFIIMKTHGRTIEEMTVKQPAAMKAAFGENPRRVYSGQGKTPATRMGTALVFRRAIIEAMNYRRKLEQGAKDPEKMPDRDLRHEAMQPVINGQLPLKIHAHRADDILTAIRLCKEFGLKYTLDHCTEGYMIADILKAENAAVIIGPLLTHRSKIELTNLSWDAPKTLTEAGVKFAMMTDHPVVPLKFLPVYVAIAVREGLDEQTALQCITLNAAEILGIDDIVGSIEPGKHADLVLLDGSPLDVASHVQKVWVKGELVHERS